MAYDAQKHDVFSTRVQNFCTSFQSQIEEAARLDAIYTQETVSGADPAFTDTGIATKQEHIDMIVFMRAFKDFRDGGAVPQLDREPNLTPFLQ